MIVEPSPFDFVAVDLEPETPKRRTKSLGASAGAGTFRVSLGVPQVQRLDETALATDPALQNFVRSHPDHRFHVLHLACTLDEDASQTLREAELRVQLTSAALGEPPIAWSMDPRRLSNVETIERKSTLGADLKFLDLGAKLGSENKSTTEIETSYVVAYNELDSAPYWKIDRNKSKPLSGSLRFSMVVKSRGGATANVSLKAEVDSKLFGLIRYRTTALTAEPRFGVKLP